MTVVGSFGDRREWIGELIGGPTVRIREILSDGVSPVSLKKFFVFI